MALAPSRHSLHGRIPGTDTYYLVNPLWGTADLLTPAEAVAWREGRPLDPKRLAERGYLVAPEAEEARFREAFLEHTSATEQEEVQVFFTLGYACNFACDYCYQQSYAAAPPATPELIASFFRYLDQQLAGRQKYITLFGGEPLLPGPSHRERLGQLLAGAADRKLDVAVVSNGYHLLEYLDLLETASVREIQVTLDGLEETHNRRRPLHGGGNTFEAIVAGIDAALTRGHRVNLRVVVDRDNLSELPALARFARDRGWTQRPNFITQLGRNYELHDCQVGQGRLYSRLELYQDLSQLIEQHPEVLEFHRPAFSITRFLFEEGRLPSPLFDACPACKTEWAFDTSGRIFPCTATVGKSGEEVGTFHPEIQLHEDRIEQWQDRDVLSIDACRSCTSQLVCGGGCGAVAKNRTGNVLAPDCRPSEQLIQLGMGAYFRKPAEAGEKA